MDCLVSVDEKGRPAEGSTRGLIVSGGASNRGVATLGKGAALAVGTARQSARLRFALQDLSLQDPFRLAPLVTVGGKADNKFPIGFSAYSTRCAGYIVFAGCRASQYGRAVFESLEGWRVVR